MPSPTQSRVEWNVVSIRPPADFNHDAKTIVVGSKSSSQEKDAALNTPPSLNPDDEDEDVGDTTNEDVKKELTKRVRVVCASSTGILYDYRVRLKSPAQAVNNDDDDDDGENNSPLLETTASSTTTNNNNNNKSECALEREIAMPPVHPRRLRRRDSPAFPDGDDQGPPPPTPPSRKSNKRNNNTNNPRPRTRRKRAQIQHDASQSVAFAVLAFRVKKKKKSRAPRDEREREREKDREKKTGTKAKERANAEQAWSKVVVGEMASFPTTKECI